MNLRSDRIREIGSWIVLNALWIPLTFQDAALMTIAVPGALLQLAPSSHVVVLSALASIAALAAMLVPPLAGSLSDSIRRTGGNRRSFIVAGLALDVAALVALAYAHTLWGFGICLVLAFVGSNLALAAYQALLPELVPRSKWGAVSGVRGAASLIGTIVGLSVAGVAPSPSYTFVAAAIVMAVCALSLIWIRETQWVEQDRARVRDWHDFAVVFAARVLVFFGLTLLQTFVLYYFRDVQGLPNPSLGTAIAAFCTMIGATASSVYLGILSDRLPRKIVTACACVPMAIAAIGFAVAPAPQWIFLYAFLFGIGFGGIFSSGWALAMDSIPAMRDVARDLGLWGVASHLPNVVAPLVGGWLIATFHGTRPGYQAVFALAGLSFALAALTVLRVGRTPLSSLWGWPPRIVAMTTSYAWVRVAYRVRHWGNVPRKRGPTLIVANHQHELDSMAIVGTVFVEYSWWRHPIFSACSRRMYEPGFPALRLPWLRPVLRRVDAGPVLVVLGLLPLENEAGSREMRDETRNAIEADLARMKDVVDRGATLCLTAEERSSVDGTIGPMRGAIDRLAPVATVYLAGVSYDPFVAKRLPMLFRLVRLGDREHLVPALAAIRPVVTSQLLASWLDGRAAEFTERDAVAAVEERLRALPSELFVDPELRRDPGGRVRAALARMTEWEILEASAGGYRLAAVRRHPQFPLVDDIVAYNARFVDETIANAAFAGAVTQL
ncbi:MAG: MFS transporter [Candidatus Tumulicola sp.]